MLIEYQIIFVIEETYITCVMVNIISQTSAKLRYKHNDVPIPRVIPRTDSFLRNYKSRI